MQTHVSQSMQLNVMAPMRTVYMGNSAQILKAHRYVFKWRML